MVGSFSGDIELEQIDDDWSIIKVDNIGVLIENFCTSSNHTLLGYDHIHDYKSDLTLPLYFLFQMNKALREIHKGVYTRRSDISTWTIDVDAKETVTELTTKSGLMLGLGEERHEIISVMQAIRDAGCVPFLRLDRT